MRLRRGALAGAAVLAVVACRSTLTPDFDGLTPQTRFGDGHDGDATFPSAKVVNACRSLVSTIGASVVLSSAGLAVPGDVLVLLQVQDTFPYIAGDPSTVMSAGEAGSWELVVVESAVGNEYGVDRPPSSPYSSTATRRAQACVVPQFRNVTFGSDLRPQGGWDGWAGGVVAVMASGVLTIEGAVTVDGDGFRGGIPNTTGGGTPNITAETITDGKLGAGKGESLTVDSYVLFGRGNIANGAGGGNSRNGGGGGGGGGGAGGFGGAQEETGGGYNDGMRGRGGAKAGLGLPGRVVFGGGGGGGQWDTAGVSHARGGNGGGIVILLARRLAGSGAIHARGQRGDTSSKDGAAGGGGGGTVIVVTEDASGWTGTINARGGDGGDAVETPSGRPPGGGGGGGRVYTLNLPGANVLVDAGTRGSSVVTATNDAWGATDGLAGSVFPDSDSPD